MRQIIHFDNVAQSWSDYQLQGQISQLMFPITDEQLHKFQTDVKLRQRVSRIVARLLSLYGYSVKMKDGKPIDVTQIKPILRKENNVVIGLYNEDNYPLITHMITFLMDIKMNDWGTLVFLALCRSIIKHPDLKHKFGIFRQWVAEYPFIVNWMDPAKTSITDYQLQMGVWFYQWIFSNVHPGLLDRFQTDVGLRQKIIRIMVRLLSLYGYTVKIKGGKPVDVVQIKPIFREENNVVIGLYNEDNYPLITRILTFLVDIEMVDLGALIFLALCRSMKNHPDLKRKFDITHIFQQWTKTQPYVVGRGCLWIDPAKTSGQYVTGSYVVSAELIMACMFFDDNPHSLLSAWYRMLHSVAIPAYGEVKNEPFPKRVIHVTNAISEQGKCYKLESRNFLHDLYMYGGCNCMCSSLLIYAIFEILTPNEIHKLWFVIIPEHIFLAVKENNRWYIIEGTQFKKGRFIEYEKWDNLSFTDFLETAKFKTPPSASYEKFEVGLYNDPVPIVMQEMLLELVFNTLTRKKVPPKVPIILRDLLQTNNFCDYNHNPFSKLLCVYLGVYLELLKDRIHTGKTNRISQKVKQFLKGEIEWSQLPKKRRKIFRSLYREKYPEDEEYDPDKMFQVVFETVKEWGAIYDSRKYEIINNKLENLWKLVAMSYFRTFPFRGLSNHKELAISSLNNIAKRLGTYYMAYYNAKHFIQKHELNIPPTWVGINIYILTRDDASRWYDEFERELEGWEKNY